MNLGKLPFMKWFYPIPVVIRRKDRPAALDWGKKEPTGDIRLFSAQKSIPVRQQADGMVYLYTENDIDFFPVEIKEDGKTFEVLPYDLRLRYVLEREKIFTRTQSKGKYDHIIPIVQLIFILATGIMIYISFDKQNEAISMISSASSALAIASQNMTQYCMMR